MTQVVTRDGFDERELLRLTASAERNSEHPLAEAIVEGTRAKGIEIPASSSFTSLAGKGLDATVDGRLLLVGNRRLMEERNVPLNGLLVRSAELAEEGNTPMFVAIDGRPGGIVAVADTIKPTAGAARCTIVPVALCLSPACLRRQAPA